jgi:hypothetical protein
MLAAALQRLRSELRTMPEPETADLHTAVSAGVAAALERLFESPDIANAIRQGVRDAVWHLGITANATDDPAETDRQR